MTVSRLTAVGGWLRQAEFHLPPRFARLAIAVAPGRLNPYRPAHDERQAIFIHVPKTGGTSICAALFGIETRHVPVTRFLASDPDRFGRYFKFAFVRNPWDRMHSAYAYLLALAGRPSEDGQWSRRHVAGAGDFGAFVRSLADARRRREVMRWPHFRPQTDWLRVPGGGATACDFIGRFEALERDFAEICARLGVVRALPRLRTSVRQPYESVYDAELIERVGELYADDIRAFGYAFR